jgi:hypothetical protein
MNKMANYAIGGLICFFLNILLHHSFAYAFINSAILLVCMATISPPANILYAFGLGIMPILSWHSESVLPGLGVLLISGLILGGVKSKGSGKIICFMAICGLLPVVILSTNGILSKSGINKEQLIIYQTEMIGREEQTLLTFKTDLWGKGVPFVRSGYIYNPAIANAIQIFKNISDFIYVPNFYQTLLLANMYLIFLGIKELSTKKQKDLMKIVIFSLVLTLFVLGLALHAGKDASIYALLPISLVLATLGLSKSNQVIYCSLLAGQLVITGWK